MAKATGSKAGRRFRSAGGRVTLKPCSERAEGEYCGPLNHIVSADSEYWSCSCGRRYSANAHKEYLKANPEWRTEAGEPSVGRPSVGEPSVGEQSVGEQ